MRLCRPRCFLCLVLAAPLLAQIPANSPAPKHTAKPAPTESAFDPGSITNNVYHNKTLGLTFKIPETWVLRTDELNTRDNQPPDDKTGDKKTAAKVLLAAFSRPPEAKGEEINSSILIAAEPQSTYPDLKEAAQYFYPLTEVAKAQGFNIDEDPYEIAIGARKLVRGDFHKDVGSRVMRQSTLALLSHGYAISITVIAGTDDDIEDLIDALSFTAPGK